MTHAVDVEQIIAGRAELTLGEFAVITRQSRRALEERHRRGTLGVRVEQAKPGGPAGRGSALMVPAGEVRRFFAERLCQGTRHSGGTAPRHRD